MANFSAIFLILVAGFTAYYFLFLANVLSNKYLLLGWRKGFVPFSGMNLNYLGWLMDKFLSIFRDPVGMSSANLVVLSFFIGSISMFKKRRKEFFLLASPIIFMLMASVARLYPLHGRLLLFSVPLILLFIAEGTREIQAKTSFPVNIILIPLIGLLFVAPISQMPRRLLNNPHKREEIRPVLNFVKQHKQIDDTLYLYYDSIYAFKYYADKYGFNEDSNIIVGVAARNKREEFIKDLDKLRGRGRVWFIFSHVYNREVNEKELFLCYLDQIGSKLIFFERPGAYVYLYDLSY